MLDAKKNSNKILKNRNLQQQIDVKSDGRASEEYAEARVGSLYTSLATGPLGGHGT